MTTEHNIKDLSTGEYRALLKQCYEKRLRAQAAADVAMKALEEARQQELEVWQACLESAGFKKSG